MQKILLPVEIMEAIPEVGWTFNRLGFAHRRSYVLFVHKSRISAQIHVRELVVGRFAVILAFWRVEKKKKKKRKEKEKEKEKNDERERKETMVDR